jgi:solute carrier family 25 citrate transporter 1
VDTIKTVQQTAALKQPLNFTEAVTKIYSAQGVQGFFKGSVPRGTRVMSAVTLMGWVNEKMETVFRKPGGGSSP